MADVGRQDILWRLVRGDGTTEDLVDQLRVFGWDSEHELVTLTRADAIRALRRFQRGQITAKDLEEWANALEGRDDVGYEIGARPVLATFLFEVANPAINSPLTPSFASAWIRRLEGS